VERWPAIRCSTDVVGEVTRTAARATGLRPGTPVVIGTGDAPAAAFGAGLIDPGRRFCVLGSSDNVVTASKEPISGDQGCNMAHCVKGRWITIATSTSAGASVEWFAQAFLEKQATAREVERLAAKSPPGANEVLFLPYLQGERTPVWDPHARGLFFGLTASTSLADMARAVLEGTAFAFRQVVETTPRKGPLIAVGGTTQGELSMQTRTSVLKKSMRVPEFQGTSTLGAAMLAGMGVGVYGSATEAVRATQSLRKTRTIRPRREWVAIYQKRFEVYAQLYPRLRGLMFDG
jgi:xylulokinase